MSTTEPPRRQQRCENPALPDCPGVMRAEQKSDLDKPYLQCSTCRYKAQDLGLGEGEEYESVRQEEILGFATSLVETTPATVYEFWKNESYGGRVEGYALIVIIDVDAKRATDDYPAGQYIHIIKHPEHEPKRPSSVEVRFIHDSVLPRISPASSLAASRSSVKPLQERALERERRHLELESFIEAPLSPHSVRVRWKPPGTKVSVKEPASV